MAETDAIIGGESSGGMAVRGHIAGKDGIYVAGDCRTKTYRQVATAIADGATAALNACRYFDH